MKTLLLLRHAKSSWKDSELSDFERPLSRRGLKAAPLMGKFLRKQKLLPDLILSSPAERARQTLTLFMDAAKATSERRFDERIYEASAGRLQEIISQTEDHAKVILVVGHNPGFEELLEMLTGEARRIPTAALARINLDVDKWAKVRERTGRLDWLMIPKELTEK